MSLYEALAMVLSRREDEPAIAAAEILAKRLGTRISVLEFAPDLSVDWAVAADGAVWGDPTLVLEGALRTKNDSECGKLLRRLERFPHRVPIKRIQLQDGAGADWAGIEGRRANLSILTRPAGLGNESFRRAMFESVLYESGRPVLLIPPRFAAKTLGKTILVAWDGSREASRALADAEPLLAKAELVSVFTVDTGARDGLSGAEAAAYLRRNGFRCQQRARPGSRQEVESLLLAECAAIDADLIVMGGYGHARLHEMLFGGITRALVRGSPAPLFISR